MVSLFPFTMAFQPIVDTNLETVYAYEALVRGPRGESASSILSQVNDENRYAFDQACRVKAITLAARLGLAETGARLSINFLPNAIYSPAACLRLTLSTARQVGFPADRLMFEVTEQEKVVDVQHLSNIISEYKRQGFKIAIDDFGAGFSGLGFLSEYTPDIIKLDMELTRGLEQRTSAQQIVRHIVGLASSLGSKVIAEGIETLEEYRAVRACGISLMQGYLFARPGLETLPTVAFPERLVDDMIPYSAPDLMYTKFSSL
jgi:EAL domain-containing protein (putative c-di-GMP-specific phosphodiesterase class I)